MFYIFSILPFFLTLFLDFKIKSPFIIFTISIGGLYFLSVPLIENAYPKWVGDEVEYLAFIFFTSYLVGRFIFLSLLKVEIKKQFNFVDIKKIKVMTGFILVISLIISMYTFDFNINEMLYSNWSEYRLESTKLELLVVYLYMCGASYLCFSVIDKDKRGILISILILLYFIIVLKSRGYIISMVVPLLVYWLNFTKINSKKIFLIVISIFFVALLYVVTRYIRWAGSIDNVDLTNFKILDLFGDDLGELQLLDVFYKIILLNNVEQLNIDFMASVKRILFFPISQFYNISPRDISSIIWDYHVGIAGVNGSYHTTVISESYLNNKNVGIFIFPLFISLIFTLFDKFFNKNPKFILMLSGVVCYSAMAISRGSSYNGFVVLFMCTFFMVLTYRFYSKWKF